MPATLIGESGDVAAVEPNKALRVVPLSRGNGHAMGGLAGTMNAALGSGSAVFAARFSPSAGAVKAYIERLRLIYTTIVAYGTPVTAGRRLAIHRGAGAATTGGVAVAAGAWSKDTVDGDSVSYFDDGQGGDIRYCNGAALGVTSITFETDPLAVMTLSHVGSAGGAYERQYDWVNGATGPVVLNAGELIAVRCGQAMDITGTWQLVVDMEWHEMVRAT